MSCFSLRFIFFLSLRQPYHLPCYSQFQMHLVHPYNQGARLILQHVACFLILTVQAL